MISQEDTEKIAEIFRLLGNPTRIKIIRVLGRDEVCVNDLAFQLNMHNQQFHISLIFLERKRWLSAVKMENEHCILSQIMLSYNY